VRKLSYWVIVDRRDSSWFEARMPDFPGFIAVGTSEMRVLNTMAEIVDDLVRVGAEEGEIPTRAQTWSAADIDGTPDEFSRTEIAVYVTRTFARCPSPRPATQRVETGRRSSPSPTAG
jgi:hypothetical protein